jgi:hypothetical protein
LSKLRETEGMAGYRASFVYRNHGRPLRGTLYPPRIVLYRVKNARYANEGHGHTVTVSGDVGALSGVIYHDDRKPLSRWLASQQSYARLEVDYLLKADAGGRPARRRENDVDRELARLIVNFGRTFGAPSITFALGHFRDAY